MRASSLFLRSGYTGLTLPVGRSRRAACTTCVSTELCLQGVYERLSPCTEEEDEGGTSSQAGRSSCDTEQPLRSTPKHRVQAHAWRRWAHAVQAVIPSQFTFFFWRTPSDRVRFCLRETLLAIGERWRKRKGESVNRVQEEKQREKRAEVKGQGLAYSLSSSSFSFSWLVSLVF